MKSKNMTFIIISPIFFLFSKCKPLFLPQMELIKAHKNKGNGSGWDYLVLINLFWDQFYIHIIYGLNSLLFRDTKERETKCFPILPLWESEPNFTFPPNQSDSLFSFSHFLS